MLWTGTPNSAIDLHPAGYLNSQSNAIAGSTQVGWAQVSSNGINHAMLWNGTSQSAVDVNPTGFQSSQANGAWDGYQVGFGSRPVGTDHALLWNGTASSYTDLHPQGFNFSYANAISEAGQVGYGLVPGSNAPHALIWNSTALSAFDLNPFVSGLAPKFDGAYATGISDDGTIVGYAQYRIYFGQDLPYAVMWVPNVPEPSTCGLMAFAITTMALARVRYRRVPLLARPTVLLACRHPAAKLKYLADSLSNFGKLQNLPNE
jgi:uncharacterized membrane protein